MFILSIRRVKRKLSYLLVCLLATAVVWFGLPLLYTALAGDDDYRTLGDPVRAEALPDTTATAQWFELLTTTP